LPRSILCGIALFAGLACPPDSHAGRIDYEFHSQVFPSGTIGYMLVDDSALARGYFTSADLLGFAFPPFAAGDLSPFSFGVSPDGMPDAAGQIGGSRVVDGTSYFFLVDFGPAAFVPTGGAFYQISGGGTPGVYGYGYWTVTLEAVPEPSSVALSGFVGLWLSFVGFFRHRKRA
jgi:hypothetical protein